MKREKVRKYRNKNKEKIRQKAKEYYKKNKAKISEQRKNRKKFIHSIINNM